MQCVIGEVCLMDDGARDPAVPASPRGVLTDGVRATSSGAVDVPGEGKPIRPTFIKQPLKALLVFIGFTGLVASVMWAGVGNVVQELSSAGLILLPIALLHIVPIVLDAAAWRALTPPKRPALAVFAMVRWVREGVNALLPGAQIGGEIVGVRMLSRLGEPAARAGAIVSIDLATEFLSMVIVGAIGAVALYALASAGAKGQAKLVGWGMVPPTLLAIVMLLVQRASLLQVLAGRVESRWPGAARRLVAAQDTLSTAWARPERLVFAVGLHSLGWVAGASETWAMLYVLGHQLGLAQAFALETTSQVLRSFGFAIPGLLGVQEGSLILVGGLLGVPPAGAVALSLFRRARDIGLGLPALGLWYIAEYTRYGRRAAVEGDAQLFSAVQGADARSGDVPSSMR